MNPDAIAAVILAAGQGTRMKSKKPKVLHPIAGRPMLAQLMATIDALAAEPGVARRIVVVSPENGDAIQRALPGIELAVQDPPLGTGHAVMAAAGKLSEFRGDVLILFADSPLVSAETLRAMLAARHGPLDPAVVVMGFQPLDSAEYARLILDDGGNLRGIVEHRDASPAEREIGLCNSGFMAIDGAILPALLKGIGNANAKGEYYLTEIVELANRMGRRCAVVEAGEIEAWGVNSREQLAQAEAVVQNRLRHAAMAAGATLLAPDSVYFCHDTILGQDVTIGPNVFFGPGVRIGDDVTVHAFCHLEGCRIAAGANIGPFARLRPETEIGEGVRIGNFVEVKKAHIEDGAKINHLSYIGDARVGMGANIGAGTITCNYDGYLKSFTDIGKGAFIGSNTALVAPVKVGDGAVVGAGSTITSEVAADALAVERSEQIQKTGWAAAYRKRKTAEKAAQNKPLKK